MELLDHLFTKYSFVSRTSIIQVSHLILRFIVILIQSKSFEFIPLALKLLESVLSSTDSVRDGLFASIIDQDQLFLAPFLRPISIDDCTELLLCSVKGFGRDLVSLKTFNSYLPILLKSFMDTKSPPSLSLIDLATTLLDGSVPEQRELLIKAVNTCIRFAHANPSILTDRYFKRLSAFVLNYSRDYSSSTEENIKLARLISDVYERFPSQSIQAYISVADLEPTLFLVMLEADIFKQSSFVSELVILARKAIQEPQGLKSEDMVMYVLEQFDDCF